MGSAVNTTSRTTNLYSLYTLYSFPWPKVLAVGTFWRFLPEHPHHGWILVADLISQFSCNAGVSCDEQWHRASVAGTSLEMWGQTTWHSKNFSSGLLWLRKAKRTRNYLIQVAKISRLSLGGHSSHTMYFCIGQLSFLEVLATSMLHECLKSLRIFWQRFRVRVCLGMRWTALCSHFSAAGENV